HRDPVYIPLSHRPTPWTSMKEGGLPSGHWAPRSLIRASYAETINLVKHAIGRGDMDIVLEALNALQDVPWRINGRLLNFLHSAKRAYRPLVIDKDDTELQRLLSSGQNLRHTDEYKKGKLRPQPVVPDDVRTNCDLYTASAVGMWPQFYTPCNLDSRGRAYPICDFNYQREDRVRGLFQFARGLPI